MTAAISNDLCCHLQSLSAYKFLFPKLFPDSCRAVVVVVAAAGGGGVVVFIHSLAANVDDSPSASRHTIWCGSCAAEGLSFPRSKGDFTRSVEPKRRGEPLHCCQTLGLPQTNTCGIRTSSVNTSRTNVIVRKPETARRSKENRSVMTTVRSISYVYRGSTKSPGKHLHCTFNPDR